MPGIRYLNVDLELESRDPLAPIVEALGEDIAVLHHGTARGLHTASLEVAGCTSGDAEATIDSLCSLVENLPPEARRLWNGCCTRLFDIGYESGDSPASFRSVLHSETVARVAALGAAIMVTIYPPLEGGAASGAAADRPRD